MLEGVEAGLLVAGVGGVHELLGEAECLGVDGLLVGEGGLNSVSIVIRVSVRR